jgi:hypothetical protein
LKPRPGKRELKEYLWDAETTGKKNLKQKVKHEFEEMAILTAYLAFLFSALATYGITALAKVILIGEAFHAGTKFERKALFYSALWKAFIFAWLVFVSSTRSSSAKSKAKLWPLCFTTFALTTCAHRPHLYHLCSAFHLPRASPRDR